jgi:hypothetical protein
MTSKLIVNSLAADTGVSTITFADQAKMGNAIFHSTGFTIGDSFLHSTGVNITNINATGVITATKFVGEVSVGSSITFEDNEKAYFGTGTDFSIYHNGSASYLDETGTGGLIVKTDTAFQVFNSAGSQPAFTVTPGGGIDLYHNTTKMLETTAIGLTINGDVKIIDNENLRLGTGNDLILYHNGSHSYIQNSTGNLVIDNANGVDMYINSGNDIYIRPQGTENGIKVIGDGAVELYNDNSRKLRTYSDGVKIASDANTGRVVLEDTSGNYCYQLTGYNVSSAGAGGRATFQDSTGAVVLDMRASGGNIFSYNTIKLNAGNTVDNLKVTFGANDDFQIYHDPNYNILKGINAQSTQFWTNNSPRWRIQAGGHIMPEATNTYDIGTSSYRVRNIYTADIHCSNRGSSNDVDGTWGDYTIQEGESDLFLINNRTGKKYKFLLQEVK